MIEITDTQGLVDLYRDELTHQGRLSEVPKDLYRQMARLYTRLDDECNALKSEDPGSEESENARRRALKVRRLCDDIQHIRMQKVVFLAIREHHSGESEDRDLPPVEAKMYASVRNVMREASLLLDMDVRE